MELYFDISELLDLIEPAADTKQAMDTLIPVYPERPFCNGHKNDAFIVTNIPLLPDLTREETAEILAKILEDTPLYQINMELLLDDALYERHNNNTIKDALHSAFQGELPNTMEIDRSRKETSGSLHHPMLGHIDRLSLARIYLRFVHALPYRKNDYSFYSKILGKHPERFTATHDGFLTEQGGAIKAGLLLETGIRVDHDTAKQQEHYMASGKDEAAKIACNDIREMIWAWLETEDFQMRRCRDLDRLLSLKTLKKTPQWVTTDIFMLLEKEAIKQYLAQRIMATPEAAIIAIQAPKLYKAISRAQLDDVNRNIQILLSQSLGREGRYAGAAVAFMREAAERITEARSLSLG